MWHLQWSIGDQSKELVLVVNEFSAAVDRSVDKFVVIATEDMHHAIDHAKSVAGSRRHVTTERTAANSWRVGRIIIICTVHQHPICTAQCTHCNACQ